MASEGAQTASGYIEHHLQNLQELRLTSTKVNNRIIFLIRRLAGVTTLKVDDCVFENDNAERIEEILEGRKPPSPLVLQSPVAKSSRDFDWPLPSKPSFSRRFKTLRIAQVLQKLADGLYISSAPLE